MDWSAADYRRFEDERTRPARDLLAQVPAQRVAAAVDLGCGPGNSTELLRARFPEARLVGIDSSPDMIAAARRRLPERALRGGRHRRLGGSGAVRRDLRQRGAAMGAGPRRAPAGADGEARAGREPRGADAGQSRRAGARPDARGGGRRALGEQARRGGRGAGGAARRRLVLAAAAGRAARVEVWRTVYHHPLAGGAKGVVDWFRATGLRPFLAPLGEEEQGAFLGATRPRWPGPIRPNPTGPCCCRSRGSSSSRCAEGCRARPWLTY